MALIEDIHRKVFDDVSTMHLQTLLTAGPVMLTETPHRLMIPTKSFSRWVALLTLLGKSYDVDGPKFQSRLEFSITNAFREHSARQLTDQPSSEVVDSVTQRILQGLDLGTVPSVAEADEIAQASEADLAERGLLLDPIDIPLGSTAIFLVGILPYAINLRTHEGDSIVYRFQALFWDLTVRKRSDLPAEIVLNMRLFNAIRALGGTLAGELGRMFGGSDDPGEKRPRPPRHRSG